MGGCCTKNSGISAYGPAAPGIDPLDRAANGQLKHIIEADGEDALDVAREERAQRLSFGDGRARGRRRNRRRCSPTQRRSHAVSPPPPPGRTAKKGPWQEQGEASGGSSASPTSASTSIDSPAAFRSPRALDFGIVRPPAPPRPAASRPCCVVPPPKKSWVLPKEQLVKALNKAVKWVRCGDPSLSIVPDMPSILTPTEKERLAMGIQGLVLSNGQVTQWQGASVDDDGVMQVSGTSWDNTPSTVPVPTDLWRSDGLGAMEESLKGARTIWTKIALFLGCNVNADRRLAESAHWLHSMSPWSISTPKELKTWLCEAREFWMTRVKEKKALGMLITCTDRENESGEGKSQEDTLSMGVDLWFLNRETFRPIVFRLDFIKSGPWAYRTRFRVEHKKQLPWLGSKLLARPISIMCREQCIVVKQSNASTKGNVFTYTVPITPCVEDGTSSHYCMRTVSATANGEPVPVTYANTVAVVNCPLTAEGDNSIVINQELVLLAAKLVPRYSNNPIGHFELKHLRKARRLCDSELEDLKAIDPDERQSLLDIIKEHCLYGFLQNNLPATVVAVILRDILCSFFEYDYDKFRSIIAANANPSSENGTFVRNNAATMIRMGKGVCSDYAFILRQLLRCFGIPAGVLSGQQHAITTMYLEDHATFVEVEPQHGRKVEDAKDYMPDVASLLLKPYNSFIGEELFSDSAWMPRFMDQVYLTHEDTVSGVSVTSSGTSMVNWRSGSAKPSCMFDYRHPGFFGISFASVGEGLNPVLPTSSVGCYTKEKQDPVAVIITDNMENRNQYRPRMFESLHRHEVEVLERASPAAAALLNESRDANRAEKKKDSPEMPIDGPVWRQVLCFPPHSQGNSEEAMHAVVRQLRDHRIPPSAVPTSYPELKREFMFVRLLPSLTKSWFDTIGKQLKDCGAWNFRIDYGPARQYDRFFGECGKLKRIFKWVKHVAPPEEWTPSLVDYFNRIQKQFPESDMRPLAIGVELFGGRVGQLVFALALTRFSWEWYNSTVFIEDPTVAECEELWNCRV